MEPPKVPPPKAQPPKAQPPKVQLPATTPSSANPVHPTTPAGNSTEAPRSDVDLPSAAETAGATQRSPGDSADTAHRAAAAAPGGDGTGPGGARFFRDGTGRGAVETARPAPLRVFFAYVWPAVALEAAGRLLEALQEGLGLPISLSGFGDSSPSAGLREDRGAPRVAGLSARSASADSGSGSGDGGGGLSILPGREVSLLVTLIACVALTALIAFAIGRELRSMRRWLR